MRLVLSLTTLVDINSQRVLVTIEMISTYLLRLFLLLGDGSLEKRTQIKVGTPKSTRTDIELQTV